MLQKFAAAAPTLTDRLAEIAVPEIVLVAIAVGFAKLGYDALKETDWERRKYIRQMQEERPPMFCKKVEIAPGRSVTVITKSINYANGPR